MTAGDGLAVGRADEERDSRDGWLMVVCQLECRYLCFFFNDTATTEIYTLSLHDALPI